MRKLLAIFLAALLVLGPLPAFAQSGGNCSVYRSWITGDSLTAGDLNSSFTSAAVTNDTQACTDGISDTVAGMRTQTDPFASQSESLATSGAGELERLRWVLSRALGWPYWYSLNENINFAHAGATNYIQGSGFARHVTAVGYHAWAGSARFPVYSTVNFHLTGLWFPRAGTQPRWTVAHHLAVSVGSGIDRDPIGIEVARFHLEALQFHHTVALRFAHSQAGLAAWQYPHITAVQVSQSQRSPDGSQPPGQATGYDQLVFGHAATVMNLIGYGASHITLGARSYIALGRHVGTLPTAPVVGALYGNGIIRAWVQFNPTTANTPVLGGWNVAGITDVDTGLWVVRWITGFSDANYAVVASAGACCVFVTTEDYAAAHVNVRAFTSAGAASDPAGVITVIAIGNQ